METWVGPAIVAAVISGLVSLVVVQLNFRVARRTEQIKREEKVFDFQIALRAEIASDLLNIQVIDRSAYLADISRRYANGPDYSVFVPQMAENVIFAALLSELHILPGEVIDPVVHYERLRQTVEAFVLDLRAPTFASLSAERQLAMYSDYLDMLERLEGLAWEAYKALNDSISSPGAGLSNQLLASAQGGASAGNSRS